MNFIILLHCKPVRWRDQEDKNMMGADPRRGDRWQTMSGEEHGIMWWTFEGGERTRSGSQLEFEDIAISSRSLSKLYLWDR